MIKKLAIGTLLCLLGACSIHVGNSSASVHWSKGNNQNVVAAAGNPVTRQGTAQEFDRLRIEAPVRVEVVDGTQWSYTITGCENQLELIGIECGSEFRVYCKKDNLQFNESEPVSMVVTMPGSLRELNVSHLGRLQMTKKAEAAEWSVGVDGMGEITIPEAGADNLTVRVSGMGQLSFGLLKAGRLQAEASGMGKLSAAGEAITLNLNGSGMSHIHLGGLNVKNAESNVSGMSKADVYVTESLRCDVSGMAHLNYGGDPARVSPEVSGMAHLKRQ